MQCSELMYIHYEMTTTKLIDTRHLALCECVCTCVCYVVCVRVCVCMCAESTNIYSLSTLQIHSAVLLSVASMPHLRSPGLTHLVTESLLP